jgi:hypothetical protein
MNKRVHADPSVGSCNHGWRADMYRGYDSWREGADHRADGPVEHDRMEHARTGHDKAGDHCDVHRIGGLPHHDDPDSSSSASNDHPGAHRSTDVGGLTVLVGGFAAASGDLTFATGAVQSTAQDRAGVLISWGDAVFDAYGYGQDPTNTFAASDTWLQVTGADLVLRRNFETSGSDPGADQAWAHSELDYMAIDIPGWSAARPTVIELERAFALQSPAADLGPFSGSLNFAAVAAAVQAESTETLALTSIQSFTDSQFSFVHAMALASL